MEHYDVLKMEYYIIYDILQVTCQLKKNNNNT